MPAEPNGRLVPVHDTHLYVVERGAPDGLPLLLLHGGPGLDHTEFGDYLDSLGDRYRLVLVDGRNQGRSDRDTDPASWTLACGEPASPGQLADLAFAWRACRSVKSNAILLARDGASVGVGMGQVNRVDSCRLAVDRAGDRAAGSVAASDAFFPFPDGPQILADAGVAAIVQPGGSVRDAEVVAAMEKAGVTMYLTGTRHFYH